MTRIAFFVANRREYRKSVGLEVGLWEPATVDGKGKAPPSVRRMWLMALRFYEATRMVMRSLHPETSNKSTRREPSAFAGER
jgi:hypothetical protein